MKLRSELERYGVAHRQQVIAAIGNFGDKHHVMPPDIETEWDMAAKQLNEFLKRLGYV